MTPETPDSPINQTPSTTGLSSATFIVAEALELADEDMQAYLDDSCGDDEDLRDEVEALLQVARDEFTEGFLAVPALEGFLDDTASAETRQILLGSFHLMECLGKGGMGTVYLAEQHDPIKRKVALKVLRRIRNARLRRRFAGECQALARLNHPNIAAMYEVDSGETAPVPYVAMEFVEGLPITAWCDEHKLSVEDRLRIFLGVCAGVSHAHEKGLLHCDLKPSNILVTRIDGRDIAKVIDFGIARALDEPLYEQSERTQELVYGSPPYISPEAVEGSGLQDLDARTDVYSLGLVLYKLLTGVLPFDFDDKSLYSVLRQINETDPVAPSARFSRTEAQEAIAAARDIAPAQLRRRLSGDLNAIILKAIEREPQRRYGSPAELAADIERHLDSRPIEARPPTPLYIAGRFARRHAALVASVALVVLALLGGLIARSMEADRANRALAESEQTRQFLVELFQNADPERATGPALTVEELLEQGTERLRTDLQEMPLVRADLLQTIGNIYTKLGKLTAAEESINEALAVRSAELPASHPDVLTSQNELGVIMRRTGRLDEAEKLLAAVLEGRKQDPDVPMEWLARAHSNLGNVYYSQRKYPEAEAEHRQALSLRAQVREADNNPETLNNEAISAMNLGVMLQFQGKFQEAREPLQRAVEVFREINPSLLGSALNNLGILEQKLPTWRKAEDLFREAIAVNEGAPGGGRRAVQSRRNLINDLVTQERWDEALAETELALAQAEQIDDVMTNAQVLRTASLTYRRAGQFDRAAEAAERCIAIMTDANGPEHSMVRSCLGFMAVARAMAGDEEKAFADVDRLLDLSTEPLPATVETAVGLTFLELGHFDKALPYLQRYLELEEAKNAKSLNTIWALKRLASAHEGQGSYDEARQLLENARQLSLDAYGPEHPLTIHTSKLLVSP